MPRRRPKRKPTFAWQAALIVLPIIVLASVGFMSLRQDRLLAKKDAQERAQAIADDLAASVWQTLAASNRQDHAFRVDGEGNLIFPLAVAEFPLPKLFAPADLNPEQLRLWNRLKEAESSGQTLTNAEIYEDFISADPPEAFKSAAEYGLGLALMNSGRAQEALETFLRLVQRHPTSLGESGLPLRPLAQLKVLELTSFGFGYYRLTNQSSLLHSRIKSQNHISAPFLASPSDTNSLELKSPLSLESFCSNIVFCPSPLTSLFLDTVADRLGHLTSVEEGIFQRIHQRPPSIQIWQDLWREHQTCRDLFRAAKPHLPNAPLALWLRPNDNEWLAIRSPADGSASWYICRPKPELVSQLDSLVAQKSWPDYLAVAFEIAGRSVMPPNSDLRPWKEVNYGGKGGKVAKHFLSDLPVPMIATNLPGAALLASAAHSEAGVDLLKANVYLTSPDELFKRQTARTFWFGSLIAVSAAAAIVGLWTAWSAFHSQQRLSEMKSNFVSSVSHELRAPIASVRLLAESLEKGKIQQEDKQIEYFRFIGQECRRLSGLIQNVLDFSRIEQGRKQYDFEPTDVMALVKETVGLMQTYAIEKEVKLGLSLDANDSEKHNLEISMDSRAIQQALVNLIDNAIKHSPKGAEVTVGVQSLKKIEDEDKNEHEDEWKLELWVEDQGPGIPLEEQEKIFERFYRVGSELRRETQGVGIGLSIVKHVVEAHKGRVKVRSAPGQGSRFTIQLPLIQTTSYGTRTDC